MPNAPPTPATQRDPLAEAGGALFVVSTPIGNLGDMTFRAVAVLRAVETVLCEDTRHSRTLLTHYAIATPVQSLHEHNEAAMVPSLVRKLQGGARFALITDAGTPAISDPGARLIAAAVGSGCRVVPIPGASAVLAALSASGLAGGPFTFLGFLERKGARRQAQIAELSMLRHPGVLYEAPQRVGATLADLAAAGCAERQVVVARELTKQYEELRRGTVGELAEWYASEPPRGEVVIVLSGADLSEAEPDPGELRDTVTGMREAGVGARDIARALVERFGIARNTAYLLAHEDP